MARRKKHEEHVNHERWVISYADFVTLLFAFFVVLFAVSQVDSKKVGRFTQSFNAASQWEVLQGHGRGLLQIDPTQSPPESAATPQLLPAISTENPDGGAPASLRALLTDRLEGKAKLEG